MSDLTKLPAAEDAYTLPGVPAAARCVFLHWNHRGVEPFVPASVAVGERIEVYVNHGRWIAECPSCHGAQYASRTDPRFFCVDCLNAWVGGQWVKLVWPKDTDVAAIETALLDRYEHHRNWTPGEKPKDLRDENDANADELLRPAPGARKPPRLAPPQVD